MGVDLSRPRYTILLGSEDITELIDVEGMTRTMTERGDASCTFTIPCADENDWPTNQLAVDADLEVLVDGTRRWLGHVVNWSRDESDIDVECAGEWDVLHQRQDYCKAMLETRVDLFQQYPPAAATSLWTVNANEHVEVSTDGQFIAVMPVHDAITNMGWAANAGQAWYIWVADGHDSDMTIRRVTYNITPSLTNDTLVVYTYVATNPWTLTNTSLLDTISATTGATGAFDSGDLGASPTYQAFVVFVYGDLSSATTSEDSIQLTDIKLYIDRTTAPTVDVAAGEIWTDVSGETPTLTTVGSALTQCMADPFDTGAGQIQSILAKAQVPPLCGVIHGDFICKPRPTAPTDNTRLWVVSDQLTSDLSWQVEPDRAQSSDYVSVLYNQILASSAVTPSGRPWRTTYPTTATTNASRVTLIDTGTDLTDAEALLTAEQAYAYYHERWTGQVVIPYRCHNGNGQESPVDHIECWDWIYNAGKANTDEAGPFLISEVSHQDGIAVLTIGAAEGYAYEAPYRLPTKGKYVGAHRVRKRESWVKWWKRTHKGKKVPKKHPKWHYGPWRDIAAKYV